MLQKPNRGELVMNKPALCLRACLLVAVLSLAAAPGQADAAWSEVVQDGLHAARAAQTGASLDEVEWAVLEGSGTISFIQKS